MTVARRLSIGGFVFLADSNDGEVSGAFVHLVEHPVVTARPDAELVHATGDFVAPAWSRIFLQFKDRPSDPQEGVVVQLEQLALGGSPKSDLRHGAS
jgi:hypothetical protein